MQYVDFFGHKVSKLIVGDNPISGHSYIPSVHPGSEMTEWYTVEHIKELLFEIEEHGINTMVPLADPFMIRVLKEYRREGGKMQFIMQPYVAMNQDASIRQIAELEPIAIYHQGSTTDFLFEKDCCQDIFKRIEQYRQLGIPVGLGTHRPDVIRRSEEEEWKIDFYFACMQNARRNREGEPSGFLSGKNKEELEFTAADRPLMLEALKDIKKPVIAFKLFAGGQMFLNANKEQTRELIKGVYQEVFPALKPNDFGVIGVFQKFSDQLHEDVELFEEWASEQKA